MIVKIEKFVRSSESKTSRVYELYECDSADISYQTLADDEENQMLIYLVESTEGKTKSGSIKHGAVYLMDSNGQTFDTFRVAPKVATRIS